MRIEVVVKITVFLQRLAKKRAINDKFMRSIYLFKGIKLFMLKEGVLVFGG
ncbi:hypothetical protein LguiA_016150 [Lonicera macranthoides]